MPTQAHDRSPSTLPFDQFWSWFQMHRNCILRAGTPFAVLLDHEDFHWDVIREDDNTEVVQLIRGKDLVGEIVVTTVEIAYVHVIPGDNQEVVFECVVETPLGRESVYHFAMSHGYEDDLPQSRRWTH